MTKYGPRAQAIAAAYGAVTGLLLVAAVVGVESAFRRRGGRHRLGSSARPSPVHPFPSPLRPGPCAP